MIPEPSGSLQLRVPGKPFRLPEPKPPILHLGVNEDGKMHAEYDPENLTEAALALMAEVTRLQGARAHR